MVRVFWISQVSFNKCVMTCIHHYSIIRYHFTAPKGLCALLISASSCPQLCNHRAFHSLPSSAFSERHVVGIVKYVALSHWLCFLHVFLWPQRLFSFVFFLITFFLFVLTFVFFKCLKIFFHLKAFYIYVYL